MKLSELFDPALYERMEEERYVRTQTHPSLPLSIVNYTELAQFAREWNEVTLNCRGLIYDYLTEEIIARGFKKFFNWDDTSQPFPPNGPVLRSPKMDGSLGILYRGDEYWPSVATRGSFTSDQATWASEMLIEMQRTGQIDLLDLDLDRYSYLVEIIYPENRIVVNYGNQERLTLLDVLDTATGKADLAEFDRVYWIDKVERISLPGFQDTMASDIPQGDEGFVFYWPEKDHRVKMKAAEYVELHRMIFSLSERSIWQRLGDGETVEGICVKLPDEFHDWVKSVAARLDREAKSIEHDARMAFKDACRWMRPEYYTGKPLIDARSQDRKAFADQVKSHPLKSYLFMLYDGRDIREAIWKTLRPEGNKGIKTLSEDVA